MTGEPERIPLGGSIGKLSSHSSRTCPTPKKDVGGVAPKRCSEGKKGQKMKICRPLIERPQQRRTHGWRPVCASAQDGRDQGPVLHTLFAGVQ